MAPTRVRLSFKLSSPFGTQNSNEVLFTISHKMSIKRKTTGIIAFNYIYTCIYSLDILNFLFQTYALVDFICPTICSYITTISKNLNRSHSFTLIITRHSSAYNSFVM